MSSTIWATCMSIDHPVWSTPKCVLAQVLFVYCVVFLYVCLCLWVWQGNGDKSSCPPRPLHTTRSVYIRHLPPKIAAEDIVEVGKVCICNLHQTYMYMCTVIIPVGNYSFLMVGRYMYCYSHHFDIYMYSRRHKKVFVPFAMHGGGGACVKPGLPDHPDQQECRQKFTYDYVRDMLYKRGPKEAVVLQ